jgi:predicted ATPase
MTENDKANNDSEPGTVSLSSPAQILTVPERIQETVIVKEAISIRNLGPVLDLTIDDIKPFAVFIGESAGGKSAIMKAVALFRWLFKQYNLRTYLRASNITRSPFNFKMDKHLEYAGLVDFVSDATDIQYSIYFAGEPQPFIIRYGDNKLETSGAIPVGGVSYSKLSYVTETRGFLPFLLKSKGRRPAFEPHFEEMVEDFERACAVRKDLDVDFLNVRFSAESTPFGWKHRVSSLGGSQYQIDFNHSSSGIQNTVPMLLLASYFAQDLDLAESFNRALLSTVTDSGKLTEFRPVSDTDTLPKRVFLHIEEPELGLFPDAQCDLLNRLVALGACEVCNPIHIMLTTHSPYILNHLNLLIKAHDRNNTEFTNGARLNFDHVAAYQVADGGIEDLKMMNQRLIDTNALSDTINVIYNRYEELK